MSISYDQYLDQHRRNVLKGFNWLVDNLPDFFKGVDTHAIATQILMHDGSKTSNEEYAAYNEYFYGGNRSFRVVRNFQKAWLHHIHNNPHHWQHWVLINDEPDEGEVALEMPYECIIEMICDWWAFSWQKGDLSEIFSWYDKHQKYIKLASNTRRIVEDILWELRDRLGYNVLAHHGIKGQKWGVRNGPPYPLDKSSESGKIERGTKGFIVSSNKFTEYALNPEKAPDKAHVFESALGYNRSNCHKLIEDIESHADIHKMVEKGDRGYGMRYEQIMRLKGPNEKEANVLTAWIEDGDDLKLTSVYVTKKEEIK